MDLSERRALLETCDNPDKNIDYLVTLSGHLPGGGDKRHLIEVRYVPDRLILDVRAFGGYLEALSSIEWQTAEDLAVTVLTDINNQIICRWVQVDVNVPELQHHAVDTHGVVLQDRQPNWDNAALLNRLERI